MATENFLAIEPLIEQRLRDKAVAKHIQTAPDLEGITEQSQLHPAVRLMYDGFRPTGVLAGGYAVRGDHQWRTIVVVKNVRAMKTGAAGRADAGEIMIKVLQALLGFKPGPGHSRLQLANPPAPIYRNGFFYLQAVFTSQQSFQGDD